MEFEHEWSHFGPALIRLVLGLMFVFAGISKLMKPEMIIGMLGELGFPAPGFLGWLLLLSEILFGVAVLVGWKVKWTVWPLVIILLVATLTVHLPKLGTDPMAMIVAMFHALGIAAGISLFLTGPGALAMRHK